MFCIVRKKVLQKDSTSKFVSILEIGTWVTFVLIRIAEINNHQIQI